MQIGLACNDEHGCEDGLTMVELPDEMLILEGDVLNGDTIEFFCGRLHFGMRDTKHVCRYTSRARYVGNMCRDQVEMEPGEVAKLVNHLRTLPHWSCTVGHTPLFEKWHRGEDFTADDFAEADS